MKIFLLYLFSIILGINFNTQQAFAQILNCKLNIDATGKYFQIGNPGGTGARWDMKASMSCITHLTPNSGDPTGWECGSTLVNNWNNKDAQTTAMRNFGINCVRIWMPGPVGRDNPNPSYTGTTMNQHYNELVTYISMCKSKGLFVLVEDWWGGYLMAGNTAAYYTTGEWHDKMLDFIHRLAVAGCDNVMFGTGNEPGQITSQYGIQWTGNWKDNTKLMIAGYRALGYTGPIMADTEGWDNQPGDVNSFAEIQNSDPSKNIGFQEHEYMNWNYAANGYFYLPIARSSYNGAMACQSFPIFATEYAYVNDGIMQALANLSINNNWGGGSYFWYNGCLGNIATINGDGLNLSAEGVSAKNYYWLAPGIPGGYYPTGAIIPVTGVTVSPVSAIVAVGATTQLTSTLSPGNATNTSVTWSSSNTSVATVDAGGLVTGVAAGSATITVTTQDGNKTSTSAITVNGGGSGATIPGKIEAESFSSMSGIQTETTTDAGGGLDVGWTDNGDYINYNVNVTSAGTYTVDFRVASPNTGTQLQIRSGSTVLSTVTIPNTGGWQNWQTVTSGSFSLPAGSQTIQVYVSGGGWNLNWMQFNTSGSGGTGAAIPGKIEAESYNAMSGIQTETTTDAGGGLDVGYTDPGDYMNYTVNVAAAGTYTVDLRLASTLTGTQIQIISGSTVLTTVTVPNTGGWQNWQTVTSGSFSLAAGSQTLQIYVSIGGWNLNWMQFNQAGGNNNLALNKPVTASSVQPGGYDVSLAVDGNGSSRWSSTFTDPSWMYVDLGATYNISRVKLSWETAYGKAYRIQLSPDAVNWTDIYSTTTGNGGVNDLTGLSGSGRYVRMYGTVRGTQFGYSLYEFEVYGSSAGTSTVIPAKVLGMAVDDMPIPVRLSVFPNPVTTTGQLNIKIEGQTENASIFIYDINGRIEFKGTLYKGEIKHVNTLTTGTHVIKVYGKDLNEVRKIVVR